MFQMKIISIIILSTIFSSLAYAGGRYTGKVQPYYYGNTLYLIPITPTIQNRPACATRNYLRLAGDINSEVYKHKFSIILSSWMAGRDMLLTNIDTNNCTSEGDEWITIVKPL